MDVEIYIEEQTRIVKKYLENTFRIPVAELSKIDTFLEIFLKNILSLKIWTNEVQNNRNSNIFLNSLIYLEEAISNLNQALILGIIGFRIPACVMMRRSLENMVSFLYYKDHPVEYFRKELGTLSTRIKDLQDYLIKYPSELIYSRVDEDRFKDLLRELIEKWKEIYRELSNYTHGSRKEYLDLKTYIEDISPRDETLISLAPLAEKVGDITNSLLITFFFTAYQSMDETKKSLIRLSIKDNAIKTNIINAFGSV